MKLWNFCEFSVFHENNFFAQKALSDRKASKYLWKCITIAAFRAKWRGKSHFHWKTRFNREFCVLMETCGFHENSWFSCKSYFLHCDAETSIFPKDYWWFLGAFSAGNALFTRNLTFSTRNHSIGWNSSFSLKLWFLDGPPVTLRHGAETPVFLVVYWWFGMQN